MAGLSSSVSTVLYSVLYCVLVYCTQIYDLPVTSAWEISTLLHQVYTQSSLSIKGIFDGALDVWSNIIC